MTSASYQLFEDDWTPGGARVEVVTGVAVEYGTVRKSGDWTVWNTEPLAERIEHARANGGKVYRRRVIIVEDWAEVDAP